MSKHLDIERLRYPIGRYVYNNDRDTISISSHIKTIQLFPFELNKATQHLNTKQLNTSYRPQGWTLRQVVHHCADSHSNALMRFKLALTEENPTIKPYFEAKWAELPDSLQLPIESSISILEGIHLRWVKLLETMNKEDYNKTYFHPESNKSFNLSQACDLYAWHCNHHLNHILNTIKLNLWTF